ncbi:MAG: hypothetical protein ABIG89_00715 [Candidatus Woesearchaeota archaeon]
MKIITDLHMHSRYSRACSKDLSIKTLEKYAKIKGVHLLGTSDFCHPDWIKELKSELTSDGTTDGNGTGILKTKNNFPFILSNEISLMYTDLGKGRKVHNVILAPNFDVVDQITDELKKRGRVDYDGRPIFKIPCPEFVEMMHSISKDIEIIPAHCLLPGTLIHSNSKLKKIESIKENDKVLTHTGNFRSVLKVYKRPYNGDIYKIIPWYFRLGLTTTSEHPFYAIKSFKKCSWTKATCKPLCSEKSCKKKHYNKYSLEWIPANYLEKGDFIVYPRIKKTIDKSQIRLLDYIFMPKGSRTKDIKGIVELNEDFCRLIGYYLAEGYVIKNEAIAFSFNKKEKEYINDVICLMKDKFGVSPTNFDKRKGCDILYYSKALNRLFRKLFYSGKEKRAWTKSVPEFMLYLPKKKQTELLRGWWRGDTGYTISHDLANHMKIICIRLGIIPSINIDYAENYNKRGNHFIDGRKISTIRDLFVFSNLSFFEGKDLLKDKAFKKFVNKRNYKHGWVDEDHLYLPIRKIEIKNYEGYVYNLEVEKDNSYVAEYAAVHNCWTPWFSVFGSMSGFDSLKDAFQEKVKSIHAIETGLSSDPPMNWRIKELDKINLVSFSDSHSYWPWRMGREATLFDFKKIEASTDLAKLTYFDVIKAIRTGENLWGTVEVDPSYGKYHIDGHRNCGIMFKPKDTEKHRGICPVCGKPLTIGVLNRVEQLADEDRPEGFVPKGFVSGSENHNNSTKNIETANMNNAKHPNAKNFKTLIPLAELLSALLGKALTAKSVTTEYYKIINPEEGRNEYDILLNTSKEELLKITAGSNSTNHSLSEKIVDAIIKNRNNQLKVIPGYDGVYGQLVLTEAEFKQKQNDINKQNRLNESKAKVVQKGLREF